MGFVDEYSQRSCVQVEMKKTWVVMGMQSPSQPPSMHLATL